MNTFNKQTNAAGGIALIPSFIASSCCLAPAMFLFFGFSFAEVLIEINPWIFRLTALLLLIGSLIVYLWIQGIRSMNDYKESLVEIGTLLLHTLGLFFVFYWIMLAVAVPAVCQTLNTQLSCLI